MEKIGIIGGTGKMGQKFANFFSAQGFSVSIAGRKTKLSIEDLVKNSDIVFLSIPISAMEKMCQKISKFLSPKTILCDFCSVKNSVMATMKKNFSGKIVGTHPIFGPNDFSPGNVVAICSENKMAAKKIAKIFEPFFITKIISPEKHDQIMAGAQNLQYFLEFCAISAITKTKIPIQDFFELGTPNFRKFLKLISSRFENNPQLYSEIFFGNNLGKKLITDFLRTGKKMQTSAQELEKIFLQNKKYFQKLTEKKVDQENKQKNIRKTKVQKIGILGPEFTFSHLAAEKFLPQSKKIFLQNFSEIFQQLENDKISAAFVPVENQIGGSIREVWKNLIEKNFIIVSQFDFRIEHVLAIPGFNKKKNFQKIFSHSQSLDQCSRFLQNFSAEKVSVSSNSAAIKFAQSEKNSAAICSKLAAKKNNFQIIAENISNFPENFTRFALITKKENENVDKKKLDKNGEIRTSIFFELPDQPGSLFKILQIFQKNEKNLTRIESMPTGQKISEYQFLIDFSGTISNDLEKLIQKNTKNFRILGTFLIQK